MIAGDVNLYDITFYSRHCFVPYSQLAWRMRAGPERLLSDTWTLHAHTAVYVMLLKTDCSGCLYKQLSNISIFAFQMQVWNHVPFFIGCYWPHLNPLVDLASLMSGGNLVQYYTRTQGRYVLSPNLWLRVCVYWVSVGGIAETWLGGDTDIALWISLSYQN